MYLRFCLAATLIACGCKIDLPISNWPRSSSYMTEPRYFSRQPPLQGFSHAPHFIKCLYMTSSVVSSINTAISTVTFGGAGTNTFRNCTPTNHPINKKGIIPNMPATIKHMEGRFKNMIICEVMPTEQVHPSNENHKTKLRCSRRFNTSPTKKGVAKLKNVSVFRSPLAIKITD